MAAVTICSDFGAQKINSDTVSTVSPSISHEVMRPDAMIFISLLFTWGQTMVAPANHSGVITHLEPDILECEVKWALENITMNKASGGDGIPVDGISNPER